MGHREEEIEYKVTFEDAGKIISDLKLGQGIIQNFLIIYEGTSLIKDEYFDTHDHVLKDSAGLLRCRTEAKLDLDSVPQSFKDILLIHPGAGAESTLMAKIPVYKDRNSHETPHDDHRQIKEEVEKKNTPKDMQELVSVLNKSLNLHIDSKNLSVRQTLTKIRYSFQVVYPTLGQDDAVAEITIDLIYREYFDEKEAYQYAKLEIEAVGLSMKPTAHIFDVFIKEFYSTYAEILALDLPKKRVHSLQKFRETLPRNSSAM